jgi:hypothetical protein
LNEIKLSLPGHVNCAGMETHETKKASSSKDPMLECPIIFEKIDDNELLADLRSPRFLLACKRLRIDPLELRSRSFDYFKDKNVSIEKQQIRFAMHERSRYQKLRTINECRFSLTSSGANGTSPIDTVPIRLTRTLSNSWIGSELSKTGPIVQKGKCEVYMAALKPLKEIAAQAAIFSREGLESSEEKISHNKDCRKDYLKKQAADIARRKERSQKLKALQSEQEQAIQAREEERSIRRDAHFSSWKTELDQKKMFQNHRSLSVQSRLAKLAQEKEEAAQNLQESLSRRQTAITVQQELFRPSTCPRRDGAAAAYNSSSLSIPGTADDTARWRRERMAQRAAEHNKQLVSEFKKQQQEFERKLTEQKEQSRDVAKVSCLATLHCAYWKVDGHVHAIISSCLMLLSAPSVAR